ncbi:hypothetical protein SLS60_009722 [Paraconiothyrium brasiliense]|uniref:Uncharacterized protein n=1 Tax=Paraconiothyrium brasiliense TaxID=300254 RepID=A0ABR3QSB7_9PLEO
MLASIVCSIVQYLTEPEETENDMLTTSDDEAAEEELELDVDAPLELGARTNEELPVLNKDVVEELTLEPSELVVLDVKLDDEVVLTNPGGGDGITTGTVTVAIGEDEKLEGTVEVRVKVTVVGVELGPITNVGEIVREEGRLVDVVGVTIELGPVRVLCTIEVVTDIPVDVVGELPPDVGEVPVDAIRDEVTTKETAGRLGAAFALVKGRVVAKDDAGGEPVT